MGRLKHFVEQYGFHPLGDYYVCNQCFEDNDIKKYISENAEYHECTFCKRKTKKKPISIHVNQFIIYLLECISSVWGDPNDEGVGWESKEGGWTSAEVIGTWDLLFNELGLEINNMDLNKLIVQTLMGKEWCQKDPHGLLLDDDLFYSWQRFTRHIKHEARYVFFKLNTYNEYSNGPDVIKEPYGILEYLEFLVNEFDLLNTIPKNYEIFRARASTKGKQFSLLNDLGPPSIKDAIYSNRMSPAGIPMFYGSFDEKTSLQEITRTKRSKTTIVSLAVFKTLDDIRVIDLTKIDPTPSIFDIENQHIRFHLSFLNAFKNDFIKPINKDGKEHIDYVPTQAVTEYFRHMFHDNNNSNIQGICYPSSRQNGGKSIVLFIDQSNCIETNSKNNSFKKPWLFLEKEKTQYL